MSEDQVASWLIFEGVGSGRRDALARVAAFAVGAISCFALVFASAASAGTCTFAFPAGSGLVAFCSDEPALADEVNTNFDRLARLLESKTGSLSSRALVTDAGIVSASLNSGPITGTVVTTASLSASAGITAATVSGGSITATTVSTSSLTAGSLSVSGLAAVGLTQVVCSNAVAGFTCTCPAGTKVLGGGVNCPDNHHLRISKPNGAAGWQGTCEEADGTNVNSVEIVVVCARLD